MRTLILTAAVLLPAPALLAQDTARAEYDQLVADIQTARQVSATARRLVTQSEAYKIAAQTRNRDALTALLAAVPMASMTDFVARAKTGAEAYAGTDGALPFLNWIVINAGIDADAVVTAVDALVADHIESDQLVDFATRLGRMKLTLGAERVVAIEEMLLEKNTHAAVLARVYNGRAQALAAGDATDEQKQQSVAAYKKLIALDPQADDETTKALAERAVGLVFVAEHLQMGMEAPEIEAEDLDGVNFKLSDYRGKVVVIDFWGDW